MAAGGETARNERAPLLDHQQRTEDGERPEIPTVQRTPLPAGQLSILFFLRFCESASTFALYPFLEELLKSVITGGEEEVGYYAGLMDMIRHSISFVAVLYWSRLSDKIGRKPILLLGTSSMGISMLCLGFSRTFWMVVLSRCIANSFAGSTGTTKSMIGELTDSTNSADAFALLHAPWAAGSSFGAFIGGWLAGPKSSLEVTKEYPYLLPCAAMASLLGSGFLLATLGLRETLNKHPKPTSPSNAEDAPIPEVTHSASYYDLVTTSSVLLASLNYTALSFLQNCSNIILPLYLGLPIRLGGLDLRPASIGKILSIYGAANSVFQALFLGRLVRWLGVKMVFMIAIAASIPLYGMYALNNIIEKNVVAGLENSLDARPLAGTYCRVAVQLVFAMILECGYGCVYMFITAASPNRQSLGSTNGIAQTMVSMKRVIAAPFAGALLSYSIQSQWLWGYGVYLTLATIGFSFLFLARKLPDQV